MNLRLSVLQPLMASSIFRAFVLTTLMVWLSLAIALILYHQQMVDVTIKTTQQQIQTRLDALIEPIKWGDTVGMKRMLEEPIDTLEIDWQDVRSKARFIEHYAHAINAQKQKLAVDVDFFQPDLNYLALDARLYLLGLLPSFDTSDFPLLHMAHVMEAETDERLHIGLNQIFDPKLERFTKEGQHPVTYEHLTFAIDDDRLDEQTQYCYFVESPGKKFTNMLGDYTKPQSLISQWRGELLLDEEHIKADCLVLRLAIDEQMTLWFGQRNEQWLEVFTELEVRRNIGLLVTFVVALLLNFLISRQILSGLNKINFTCNEVTKGDLGKRIVVSGSGDDYDRLAININQMLDKIEDLMQGIKHVSDSIAHDLRTPLTRLHGKVDLAINSHPEATEQLGDIAKEAQVMMHIFESLLRISQVETGSVRQSFKVLDLKPQLAIACEYYQVAFEQKQIHFQRDLPDETMLVLGDVSLLLQMMMNLLDNAVKYTPVGGLVKVNLERQSDCLELKISDSGKGICQDEFDKVFERFYRSSKHTEIEGHGLGLAFVKAAVNLHKGQIELNNSPGLCVSITLPLLNL